MIRKVWLRNWKAYDSIDLNFEEGTTFLVAENGVGKSSIIQGMHFAIFGSPYILGTDRPVADAVRGHDGVVGTVGCEISLGSKRVRIEREVVKASRKSPTLHIEIDGRLASESDWSELLGAETGVDATQLALLAFVGEGAMISLDDVGLSTVKMLEDVFGVGRLRRAAHESTLIANRLDRDSDNLRKSLRDNPSRRDAKQLAVLQEQLVQRNARLEALQERKKAREDHESVRRAWVEYSADEASYRQASEIYHQRLSEIANKLGNFLPDLFSADSSIVNRASIVSSLDRLSDRREQDISERGRLEAMREASLQHKTLLSGDSPRCPTCRQPLSKDAAERAITEHQEAIGESTAALQVVDDDLHVVRQFILEVQEILNAQEPSPPLQPSESAPEFAGDDDTAPSLESEISELEQDILTNKAELMAIQRIEEQRKENDLLSMRLAADYRKVERGHLAAETMTRLADAICADRITPLAEELQKRSPTLCFGSKLFMDATGAVFLQEGDYTIPYYNLSGGQRTLVQLAVRLLALQMATKCPFFVLDEPLEHLDPRNRRSLATLLVHASHGSSRLRQVLVTTYEESVTRRLTKPSSHLKVKSDEIAEVGARVVRISGSQRD